LLRVAGYIDGIEDRGGTLVTGRARLPGGEQRQASQKRSRPAVTSPAPTPTLTQILHRGDRVRWSRYTGTVQRVADDVADVRQDGRDALWRLSVAELTRMPPSAR